jgi:DNA excision repair protein ERCC-1
VWSNSEAARYLETLKSYENHSASIIKKRVEKDHSAQFGAFLMLIRSVNKTDVVNLGMRFGSLKGISAASVDELCECPGVGYKKAMRIYQAFRQPFGVTK